MTKREIGEQISDEILRSAALKAMKKAGVTLARVSKRIAESLDATEVKTHYDKDRGKWVYSTLMIDWAARAKAIDQAICILDLKPVEKRSIEIDMGESVPERINQLVKGITEYAHQE